MKIVFVANRYPPAVGGAEIIEKRLAEGLVKKGHEVVILTTDFMNSDGHDRVSPKKEKVNGVSVIRCRGIRMQRDPLTWSWEMFVQLWNMRNRCDIIHVFSYGYYTSWMPASLKWIGILKTPLVFQPHYAPNKNFPQWMLNVFDATLGKLSLTRPERITTLTDMYHEYFLKVGVKKDVPVVIPPIVPPTPRLDTSELDQIRSKFNIPKGKKNVLALSRLVEYKGFQYVVAAFQRLLQDGRLEKNALHLIVAGDGDYRLELEKQVAEAGLTNHVTFTGLVIGTDNHAMYNFADLFALLSYSGESFGVVFVEAMSLGVPLLGSNIGAIPKVVIDGTNGRVVDPYNADEVADAVVELISGPDVERYRENNLKESRNYSEEAVISRMLHVYEDALKQSGS